MKFKTLSDFSWKGKLVLLRSDLNSPVVNGKIRMNARLKAALTTITELKRKGAKVVVLAHQGQPGGKDFISLRQHAKLLKVKFVPDVIGKEAIGAITNLKNGQVLLLENVRSLDEEFHPSVKNDLVRILSPLFDVYVNDAFSVCHRRQTSIVSFPLVMKSCIGRTMERELKHLGKIKLKDCLVILGGAKVGDKKLLISRGRKTLLTGKLALDYRGRAGGVVRPVDFVGGGKDIGPETIEIYRHEIAQAKFIFLSGPAGLFEDKRFENGTREILKAVANSLVFSVVGGGHTVRAIRKFKIPEKSFGYVSLAGGALIWFLAGRKLVGLEALGKKRK